MEDLLSACSPTLFTANSTVMLDVQWPTASGMTEAEAEAGCRERIVNVTSLGQNCYDSLVDTEEAETVVRKCVDDVQV